VVLGSSTVLLFYFSSFCSIQEHAVEIAMPLTISCRHTTRSTPTAILICRRSHNPSGWKTSTENNQVLTDETELTEI
jgi:hypothetical protein